MAGSDRVVQVHAGAVHEFDEFLFRLAAGAGHRLHRTVLCQWRRAVGLCFRSVALRRPRQLGAARGTRSRRRFYPGESLTRGVEEFGEKIRRRGGRPPELISGGCAPLCVAAPGTAVAPLPRCPARLRAPTPLPESREKNRLDPRNRRSYHQQHKPNQRLRKQTPGAVSDGSEGGRSASEGASRERELGHDASPSLHDRIIT
jgi:hypothetical protein